MSELTKSFGDRLAVDDVNAVARPGEVTALLGPNGAGKTTTPRMLLELAAPGSGVALLPLQITSLPPVSVAIYTATIAAFAVAVLAQPPARTR